MRERSRSRSESLLFAAATAVVAAARRRRLVHRPRTGHGARRPSAARARHAGAARPRGGRCTRGCGPGRGQRSQRPSARSRSRERRSRSGRAQPSARAARTGPGSCSAPSALRCSARGRRCSGARASRAGCAGSRRAGLAPDRRRALLARRAGRDGDPRHPPPPRRRDAGRPRSPVRAGDGADRRRPRLAGWYVRSHNGAAVISYPTREGKLPQARMLARHGYGVLLLDARGYDGSQGDPNVFGWDDTKDIDAAVAWLRKQPDVRGGRDRRDRLLRRRRDDAPSSRRQHRPASRRLRRRRLPLGARRAAPRPARLVHVAPRAGGADHGARRDERHRPTAVAQGPRAADRAAPRLLHLRRPRRRRRGINPDYYAAAGAPKALWKIPEAGHTGGYQARPREYERRVVGFFDTALLERK